MLAGQLDRAPKGVAAAVRVQGALVGAQLLEKVTRLFEHVGLEKGGRNGLHQLLVAGQLWLVGHHGRRLAGHAARQVQVDGLHVLALVLLELGCVETRHIK